VRLLVVERPAQHDADHEPLRPIVEVVDVDDVTWRSRDPVPLRFGDVAADQVLDVPHRPVQPPDERVDRAGADGAARPPRASSSSSSRSRTTSISSRKVRHLTPSSRTAPSRRDRRRAGGAP
jgi:hypothetical protein